MNLLKGNFDQLNSLATIVSYLEDDDFIKLQEKFCETIKSDEKVHYMCEIDNVCSNMKLSSVLELLDDNFSYKHNFFIKTTNTIKSDDYPTELTPFDLLDFAEFLMDYGDYCDIVKNNMLMMFDNFAWYAECVIIANKLDIVIDDFVNYVKDELTDEYFTEKWENLIIRMLNEYKYT